MCAQTYESIAQAYPSHIPLPKIQREHHPGRMTSGRLALSEVRCEEDLPSRLVFGDVVPGSFRIVRNGWSIEYRGFNDSGLDLSVRGDRFEARPRFLGEQGMSVGSAIHPEAFAQLLSVEAGRWNHVLKTFLEERHNVQVAPSGVEHSHKMYLPDGWLKSLFVPVSPEQLGTLFNWHIGLAEDERLGAAQMGSISLLFNSVNYIEGKCPEGFDDPEYLLVRGLMLSNGPVVAQVVREQGSDGTAAWTARRLAYLYRCDAFLRDVPRIVESLDAAGLISEEPDLIAGVVPAEIALVAEQLQWWSPNQECRVTWVLNRDQLARLRAGKEADAAASAGLINDAMAAGRAHREYFSATP